MSEKLNVKWNDFNRNLISTFGKLRGDKEFTDVTLTFEDGQQMEVHKVILAASSPFFENLLRATNHPQTEHGVTQSSQKLFLIFGRTKLLPASLEINKT